jgi:hypothetical protein
MITLESPEKIGLSNKAFRNWMLGAGFKIEELDEKHYNVLTNYYLSMDGNERDLQLFDLKFELIELKMSIKAVMSLWGELKHEMP